MSKPKSDFASEVLTKAWKMRHRTLSGVRARQIILEKARNGEDVTADPRMAFMLDAANLVRDFILDIAKDFDTRHPQDKMSTLDVGDILKLVESKFK